MLTSVSRIRCQVNFHFVCSGVFTLAKTLSMDFNQETWQRNIKVTNISNQLKQLQFKYRLLHGMQWFILSSQPIFDLFRKQRKGSQNGTIFEFLLFDLQVNSLNSVKRKVLNYYHSFAKGFNFFLSEQKVFSNLPMEKLLLSQHQIQAMHYKIWLCEIQ